jgi:hypothetical protein
MQYKTIVLELLTGRVALHDQLRQSRQLLPTIERLALELRTSHLDWQDRLYTTSPDSTPEQLASESLELALQELIDRLPSLSNPPDDQDFRLVSSLPGATPPPSSVG